MFQRFKNVLFNRWSAFLHDLCWVPAVIVFCFWVRFDSLTIPAPFIPALIKLISVALPVQAFSFWFFGLYRGLWRYVSMQDLIRVVQAVGLGSIVVISLIALFFTLEKVPRTVLVLYPLLLTVGLIAPRIIWRWLKSSTFSLRKNQGQRTLIVGGGYAGELLIRELATHPLYSLVAVVDDDRKKQGREIHGVRVAGGVEDIGRLIEMLQVEVILIAIAGADRKMIRAIAEQAAQRGVECLTIPSSIEIMNGRITVDHIRPVTVEDLLGRDPVTLDSRAISAFLGDKTVLVSGGGGSIGSELCRQILSRKPRKLIIFENSEFNLYAIEHELRKAFPNLAIDAVLGDVKNERVVNSLFAQHHPEVVFHAAAYKHVPLVEKNINAGVKNNVCGTVVIANAAHRFGTGKFVLVSTDKAVNPTNVMGVTKRIAEIYCQNLNVRSQTAFITTRFGNVLGSAGSVVPLFTEQIRAGGPVTVTSREVKRFFMTIPEATSLILQAGSMGGGGEIYILDMGEPVLIRELAEQMIRLSGYEPYTEIPIEYIGLRPGEKLFEELVHTEEGLHRTEHPKLHLAESRVIDWRTIVTALQQLDEAIEKDDAGQVRAQLLTLVPEYDFEQG